MDFIPNPEYIECSFSSEFRSNSTGLKNKLDIFYAKTEDLNPMLEEFQKYLFIDEKLRAGNFSSEPDRKTYITSHAILRIILAKYLNDNPLNIKYILDKNHKPGLKGNPIFFNITHTKDAFAIAIAKDSYVGIDLENIDQPIEIHSIAKSFFSKKECEFIFKSNEDAKCRFFLLWTRKEALLKALGTGIIDNLEEIEIVEQKNYITPKSFQNLISFDTEKMHFIHSKRWLNYYLSVAIPVQAPIYLLHLLPENISQFFA
jgi:4'-phosphopantetheinyl transferase